MPTTSKRIDKHKHKHLGAHGGTFCLLSPYIPYLSNHELHVQGGKDQVREGLDWSTRLLLAYDPYPVRALAKF